MESRRDDRVVAIGIVSSEAVERTKALAGGGELSALSRSELGAGDVLVATRKQGCSDSSDPLGHARNRGRETVRSRLMRSRIYRGWFCVSGSRAAATDIVRVAPRLQRRIVGGWHVDRLRTWRAWRERHVRA
jgi:hypothetical protein